MQRKNNLLTYKYSRSRHAIAMIMAIAVIVIVATVMALALAMTSQTTKRTNDLYLYEQAVLFSKSATEYALLRISQDSNTTQRCPHVNDLSFTQDVIYNISITNRYVYTATALPPGCPVNTILITTPEQNGSVLMDVTVSVDDTSISTEPIRFFKRTIQKL